MHWRTPPEQKQKTKREVVTRDHVLEVTKLRTTIGTRSMTPPMTAIAVRATRSLRARCGMCGANALCRTLPDPANYRLADKFMNIGFNRGPGISLTYQSYVQISVSCPILSDLPQKHPETFRGAISGVLLSANRPFLRRQRSVRGPSDSRSPLSPSNADREKSSLGVPRCYDCELCPVACMW
jgi:hypothetical protein